MSLAKGELRSLGGDSDEGGGDSDIQTPSPSSSGRRRRNRGSTSASKLVEPKVDEDAIASSSTSSSSSSSSKVAGDVTSQSPTPTPVSTPFTSSVNLKQVELDEVAAAQEIVESAANKAAEETASTAQTPSSSKGEQDADAAEAARKERRRLHDERLRQIEEEVSINTASSDRAIIKEGMRGRRRRGTGVTPTKIVQAKRAPRDFVALFRVMGIIVVALWMPFSSISLGIFVTQFVAGLLNSWFKSRTRLGEDSNKGGWLQYIMYFFDKGLMSIVTDYVVTTSSEMALYLLVRSLRAGVPPFDPTFYFTPEDDKVGDDAAYHTESIPLAATTDDIPAFGEEL